MAAPHQRSHSLIDASWTKARLGSWRQVYRSASPPHNIWVRGGLILETERTAQISQTTGNDSGPLNETFGGRRSARAVVILLPVTPLLPLSQRSEFRERTLLGLEKKMHMHKSR
jgi:hypothetical protein